MNVGEKGSRVVKTTQRGVALKMIHSDSTIQYNKARNRKKSLIATLSYIQFWKRTRCMTSQTKRHDDESF